MEFHNILIRRAEYIANRDKDMLTAMLNADSVPIYYEYSQTEKPKLNLPDNCLLGYASNIHIDNELVVCDVKIFDLLKLARHFDGTIDNYTFKLHKGKSNAPLYELVKFTVYDKELKRRVEEKLAEKFNDITKSEEI